MEKDCFYSSDAWLKIRFRVLNFYKRKCMCCGSTEKPLHVDHIKPRSKYPELQLTFTNLQILCEFCNKGKSNIYETDFRRKHHKKKGSQRLPSYKKSIT